MLCKHPCGLQVVKHGTAQIVTSMLRAGQAAGYLAWDAPEWQLLLHGLGMIESNPLTEHAWAWTFIGYMAHEVQKYLIVLSPASRREMAWHDIQVDSLVASSWPWSCSTASQMPNLHR